LFITNHFDLLYFAFNFATIKNAQTKSTTKITKIPASGRDRIRESLECDLYNDGSERKLKDYKIISIIIRIKTWQKRKQ
jgi:hypothetical protein